MPSYASNKKAFYDYTISDTLEAGLVLDGPEVKSIRNSQVSLNGAYVSVRGGEAYLKNAFIARYKNAANKDEIDENRDRKLLLHKEQIGKLANELDKKGTVVVPLEIYTSNRRIKLKIGIGTGKKQYDKRASIKKKEDKRSTARAIRTQI